MIYMENCNIDTKSNSASKCCFTSSFFELRNFVLVVAMIGIWGLQEVEFWVVHFILPNSVFKLWTISGDKACSLVNNVFCELKAKKQLIHLSFIYQRKKN